MTLETCITEATGNKVLVTETTDGNQYLPEGSSLTAKNRFIYTDTAAVDIFKLNATTGESFSPAVITLRSTDDVPLVTLDRDGWFTSIHIVIPTETWVYGELSKSGSIINVYDKVYYTDGKDIFTCVKGTLGRSNLQELIDESGSNVPISRVDTEYFSVKLLQEQCDAAWTTLIENRIYNGGCGSDACDASRLWAAINLIRHYVRWGQLAEAERLVEQAGWFNLSAAKRDKKKSYGCGCL